jgi:hypothetical protein
MVDELTSGNDNGNGDGDNNQLIAAADEAASILLHLMRNARSEYVRLNAARAVLDTGDLIRQIKQHEKTLKDVEERLRWSLPR